MKSRKAKKETSIEGPAFDVRKTPLANGLVVVSEKMPHVRSVSFGVFLKTGSRLEKKKQHGLTHFIEHALFKGSRKRSAAQIAAETDALGGHLDAFTGRDLVGFYNKVLDEQLPAAFELMADLVLNPAFDPVELEKERNVILEEIKMVEDTPDDLVFEIFCESFYPDHPLGRPILGTPKSLGGFDSKRIRDFYDDIFRPGNIVIAAAGNLEHEKILGIVEQYFGRLKARRDALTVTAPAAAAPIVIRRKAELEQAHLVLGMPCPSLLSKDRYVVNLLSVILGGGMSSRLFQSVREDLGLVYAIYASVTPYVDCGYLNIYAATSNAQLKATIDAVMQQLRRIKDAPIPEEELRRNKDQLKAAMMLNLESSSSRMSVLAQSEMNFGRFLSLDENIAEVDAVTVEDIQRLAREIFRPEALAVTVLGPMKKFTMERSRLSC